MDDLNESSSYLPFSPTKRELIMISSYQKRLQDQKERHYKTIEHVRNSVPSPPDLRNLPTMHNQTNVINMELDQQVLPDILAVSHSPDRRKKATDNSLKKLNFMCSNRTKNAARYPEGFRQIFLKKGNSKGMKVFAKFKEPLADDRLPMRKYMKIERIPLPKPNITLKVPGNVQNLSGVSSQGIRRTINEYDSYLKKVTGVKTAKRSQTNYSNNYTHKRNYSSTNSVNESKKKQNSFVHMGYRVNSYEKNKKIVQEFNIRKPAMRKDYFVFGMGDRPNTENKIEYFRDMLWKVNFSNGLYVQTPESIPNLYKAYIGPGNNYYLVKGVLKRRFWWSIVEKPETPQAWQEINFVWTQLKQNNYFKLQKSSIILKQDNVLEDEESQTEKEEKYDMDVSQIRNCSEGNQDETREEEKMIQKYKIANSSHKFRYLKRDFSASQNVSADLENHKKIFFKTDTKIWEKHFQKNMKTEQKIGENTYNRRINLFYTKQITRLENSEHLKVQNHLENNFFIGNKKALFYNIRRYFNLRNKNPFEFIPMTFHIKGVDDPEYKSFKEMYEEIEREKSSNGLRNMWIVKPGQNTNRGNGITVAYCLDDVNCRLKGRERNADGKLRTFIIQKYLQRPLLYNKRKFDIRHYMLVTCMNGSIKGYWYEEGYIRTSSFEYSMKYCKDPLVHLTNDAIQKNCSAYGKFEKGNKLSYQDFQRYLDSTVNSGQKSGNKINFFNHILPQLQEIAAESLRASYALLDPNRKEMNFELLGLDFMLDEDLKPWLIEVNTNPCLEISCSLLEKLIPNLIDNVFKICIDPIYPPPQNWQSGKKFYFGDNPLSQNKFQIIFDEGDDGNELQKLYKGSVGLVDQKMGKVEEDNEIFEDDGDEDWENTNNKKILI